MTGDITKYVRKQEYDPLNGKWIRATKASDIVLVGDRVTTTSTGDITINTVTTDANTVLYPYLWVSEASTDDIELAIVVGTSTQHSIRTGNPYVNTTKIEMRPEAPITKVGASSSISIVAVGMTTTADVIESWITCKREPISEKLEPNLF